MTKRRRFTATFKAEVVLAVLSGHKTLLEVAKKASTLFRQMSDG